MSDFVRDATFGKATDIQKAIKKLPEFKAGDTIAVYSKIKEGGKERLQKFQGVVLKVQGSGMGKSFTVRKMSSSIGVEKTYPFSSPFLDKIELISKAKVRRGRLFFLRELSGRAARLKSDIFQKDKEKEKDKEE
ncbi:MAG: 50S ribosomal protein L19 [Bdellovibrionales bacterium]|nr:50S ribosomal protein L19 [Bdellovibrionales bacterium]